MEWAVAAESIQDWDAVEDACSGILARADVPTYGDLRLVATLGLAKVAGVRGERERLDQLAAEAQQLAPGSSMVTQMLQEAYGRLARAEAEAKGRAASGAAMAPDSPFLPVEADLWQFSTSRIDSASCAAPCNSNQFCTPHTTARAPAM